MTTRAAALLSVALLISTAACAQSGGNWMGFATTQDGAELALNLARLKRDPINTFSVDAWMRSTTKNPRRLGSRNYTSTMTEFRVDCRAQTIGQLQIIFYDRTGTVVASDSRADSARRPAPDTVGEHFLQEVCTFAEVSK